MTARDLPGAFPGLSLTELDGVRTLWSDLPGPLWAGLLIRVGSADETLVSSGTTHLLEHLAMSGLGRPGDHSHGQVEQTTSIFHYDGDTESVIHFLDQLTRQLVEPPMHRLPDEREIVRAEYAASPASAEHALLSRRYGAQTYGLAGADGLALDRLDDDHLRAWSHRYATRQNSVLWMSRRPPAGVRLHLPDGAPILAPSPWTAVLPQFPAYFPGPVGTAALSAVVSHSRAASALGHVLRARLIDELCTRRVLAHSPDVRCVPLTGDVDHLLAGTDLVAGHQSDGLRRFIGVLHDLAGQGDGTTVTDAELADWRGQQLQENSDPLAGFGRLVGQAREILFDRPLHQPDELPALLAAVGPRAVTAVAAAALSSALARIPHGIVIGRQPWTAAVATTARPLQGRRFEPHEADPAEHLTLHPAGLTWHGADGGHVTVTQQTAAAVQAWPDGRRTVHGTDATVLVVEPTLWQGGPEIVEHIDRLWPATLVVPMPPRPTGDIPWPRSGPARVEPPRLPRLPDLPLWPWVRWALVLVAFTAGLLACVTVAATGTIPALALGLVFGWGIVLVFRNRPGPSGASWDGAAPRGRT